MLRLGGNLVCLPYRSHLASGVVGRTTLICFPGFLEDARYFPEVHRDTLARLIIINKANYQNPFREAAIATPAWFAGSVTVCCAAPPCWTVPRNRRQ
jgi:hypothetical protein